MLFVEEKIKKPKKRRLSDANGTRVVAGAFREHRALFSRDHTDDGRDERDLTGRVCALRRVGNTCGGGDDGDDDDERDAADDGRGRGVIAGKRERASAHGVTRAG